MRLASGTRLGRYEIRSKLGEGGMGEVYLAQDTKLDRKVGLKSGRASEPRVDAAPEERNVYSAVHQWKEHRLSEVATPLSRGEKIFVRSRYKHLVPTGRSRETQPEFFAKVESGIGLVKGSGFRPGL